MSRTVLVTGGNRGIGLAIAKTFAAAGDKVAITDITTTDEPGLYSLACDVTDSAAVDAAFTQVEAELGPVDVLVANAGITRDTLMLRMDDDQFQQVIDTNLGGAFKCSRRAIKTMLRQKRGRIVFLSSVVGMLGSAGQTNYAASKSGLVGLARSIAREYGSRGITANLVAPGFVKSAMTDVLSDDKKAEYFAQIPLGRFTTPEEIAGVVEFLASDRAAYITGAIIPIDGGLGMGH